MNKIFNLLFNTIGGFFPMRMLAFIKPLAAIIALLGALSFSYWAGVKHERTIQTSRINAQLADYGQRLLQAQTQARDTERASVNAIHDLTVNYEKRLHNESTKTSVLQHDIATGARRLYISTSQLPASASVASATGTATAAITQGRAELSKTAAEFLINLASECDSTAEKLNLAIDIAESDRAIPIALTNKEIDQ